MSIGFNLFEERGRCLDKLRMEPDALNRLISANLKSLMEEKGLNASAWAKQAGLSHTGVRDIILRKVKNPTYRTLLNLAETAGVDVRRITVGPHFAKVDEEQVATIHLLSQLEESERHFLINAAKAQIAARDQSLGKSDEDAD